MPVSFAFTNRKGKDIPIAEIDDEICRMLGKEPHPVRFSIEYEVITSIGIDCTFRGPFDNTVLNKAVERFQESTEVSQEEKDKWVMVMRHFLGGEYTFRSWR